MVGNDFFGERVRAVLAGAGVDVGAVLAPPGSRTTTSNVLIDDAAQHVFVWMRGTGEPPRWRGRARGHQNANAIFTTGYALQPPSTFTPAAVASAIELAHARSAPVFFDLGPVVEHIEPAVLDAVIGRTTVFLATAAELAGWLGEADPERAASLVLARGPRLAIVKLGADGCLIANSRRHELVRGFVVPVRDTTGAGNSFSAACIYGYLHGLPARQSACSATPPARWPSPSLAPARSWPPVGSLRTSCKRTGLSSYDWFEFLSSLAYKRSGGRGIEADRVWHAITENPYT